MIRQIRSLDDARSAIVDIYKFMARMETKDINLHGRRIVNAGPSRGTSDYVIRTELAHEVSNLVENLGRINAVQNDLRERIWRLENP